MEARGGKDEGCGNRGEQKSVKNNQAKLAADDEEITAP